MTRYEELYTGKSLDTYEVEDRASFLESPIHSLVPPRLYLGVGISKDWGSCSFDSLTRVQAVLGLAVLSMPMGTEGSAARTGQGAGDRIVVT